MREIRYKMRSCVDSEYLHTLRNGWLPLATSTGNSTVTLSAAQTAGIYEYVRAHALSE